MESTTRIMGILNVTPDSFSDGGRFCDPDVALQAARAMIAGGASIIDVGAESTAPGSAAVPFEEEWGRLKNVLSVLQNAKIPFSVDTSKAEIAQRALDCGASMINDVTALRADSVMWQVMAQSKVPFVIMYAKDDSPRTTLAEVQYDDPIATIIDFFQHIFAKATGLGIDTTRFLLDPGMGAFLSADPQVSYTVLRRLEEIKKAFPQNKLLIGTSRKGFLRTVSDPHDPQKRLIASVVSALWAARNGADFIRVHDVSETHEALMTEAMITNAS